MISTALAVAEHSGALQLADRHLCVLDPAFCSRVQLLRYDGYDLAHPMLPGPVRPMVAHAVSLEAVRRTEVRCDIARVRFVPGMRCSWSAALLHA